MKELFAAMSDALADGERKLIKDGKHEIGLFRWGGKYYAYSNFCLHQGGPACEGLVMHKTEDVLDENQSWLGQKFSDTEVHFVCPWHGYEYDLFTGECVPDRRLRLRRYEVVEKGNEVYVRI